MTHTKGPYGISKHATHCAQFGLYSESDNSGRQLAIICSTGNDCETAANASLFAAAPDLLAAVNCALADLLGIMPEFETSGDRNHPAWLTIRELQNAITKAESGL